MPDVDWNEYISIEGLATYEDLYQAIKGRILADLTIGEFIEGALSKGKYSYTLDIDPQFVTITVQRSVLEEENK